MKLRNIILSLIAFAAVTVSCQQEIDHYLDNFKVSSSYASLSTSSDVNSCTIVVDATEAWTVQALDPKKEGAWLTVSPMSGSAGQLQITFSAGKTLDGRSAEVRITCGGQTQIINVIQGLSVVSEATCAEVIAGPDSKTYRVKGICTSIANTEYGNWYLDDGTGVVYIYGTLNDGQAKKFSSLNPAIEVGDEVLVEGPKTTYNGTVELVDVTVVQVNKSLIKVENVIVGKDTTNVVPVEGGQVCFDLMCKGSGIYVSVPEDAKSWLSISSLANNKIYFDVKPNEGGDRETLITFSTSDGKKNYNCEATLKQKGAIIAATIAEFNAAPVSSTVYRLQGVVTSIAKADYGNIYIKDATGETYIYGIGAKGDFAKTGIKVGDIIQITGNRGEYKTTIEVLNTVVEKVTPVTEVSVTEFLGKPDDKNTWYMVTGVVTNIANSTYGNLYMKDAAGSEVYVYGCYPGWNATGDLRKKFSSMDIAVDDELTMIGYKDTYNGTIELCGGVYFSHKKAD